MGMKPIPRPVYVVRGRPTKEILDQLLKGECEVCGTRDHMHTVRAPEDDVELIVCFDCALATAPGWHWFMPGWGWRTRVDLSQKST